MYVQLDIGGWDAFSHLVRYDTALVAVCAMALVLGALTIVMAS